MLFLDSYAPMLRVNVQAVSDAAQTVSILSVDAGNKFTTHAVVTGSLLLSRNQQTSSSYRWDNFYVQCTLVPFTELDTVVRVTQHTSRNKCPGTDLAHWKIHDLNVHRSVFLQNGQLEATRALHHMYDTFWSMLTAEDSHHGHQSTNKHMVWLHCCGLFTTHDFGGLYIADTSELCVADTAYLFVF